MGGVSECVCVWVGCVGAGGWWWWWFVCVSGFVGVCENVCECVCVCGVCACVYVFCLVVLV